MINDTKVDVTSDPRFQVIFVDIDGNNVNDRMVWIVPQLSEQEFDIEADISIINVQSYPIVGGNWTVYFNTTGTADLTIKGIAGTTFGETLPDDLKFLELNNGTHTLSPIINLTANTITYHNYTSNYTGFEASQVLTDGKHHLEFTFGNDVAYAHNLAVHEIPHAFQSVTSQQQTSNTAFVDIPNAYIKSSNFTAGHKYFLYFTGITTGSGTGDGDRFTIRAAHGSNEFAGSKLLFSPSSTSTYHQYAWFTVWEASAGEDIKLQFNATSGDTISADQITLFSMDLSERFIEIKIGILILNLHLQKVFPLLGHQLIVLKSRYCQVFLQTMIG
jgi:hypothetical protein